MTKFKFGVIGINHGHIYWMVKGLLETGQAECVGYYSDDDELKPQFKKAFPAIPNVRDERELLEDPEIQLICVASRFNLRAKVAIQAMKCGKDVFVDKPAATTLAQLQDIERVQKETGKSWFVWFSERLPDPSSRKAFEMIQNGTIGKLVNFIGLGPHKLNPSQRPSWFFDPAQYGGIINDIGVHNIEVFCQLVQDEIKVDHSRIGNYQNKDRLGFEDFGDTLLHAASGPTAYIRVDWLTPESLPTFGDIRQIFIGTEGMIELRKTVDFAVDNSRFTGRQLLFATHKEPPKRLGFEERDPTIFKDLVADILQKTQKCIPLKTCLQATWLALLAQEKAARMNPAEIPCPSVS